MADFTPAPVKPTVDIAILEQLDVRVGTIVAIEDLPQSTRLVRLVQAGAAGPERKHLPSGCLRRQSAAARGDGGAIRGHAVRSWLRRRRAAGTCGAGITGAERRASGIGFPQEGADA